MATAKERQIQRDKTLEEAVKRMEEVNVKIDRLIEIMETLAKGKKK
jgi:hypothetical protein